MSRSAIAPILQGIPAARQMDARHYGVHPYFTRRPANVVRAYIERFTRDGDVVLDPFGGSGVTAIEAMLLGRTGIHNDLNPFANFIAQTIADTTLPSVSPVLEAFSRIERPWREIVRRIQADPHVAAAWLKKVPLPENIELPRNSDARRYFDLFTPAQLAGLAVLKQAVELEKEAPTRNLLLLAWSASLAKLNKTFLSAKGRAASRGGSSIFSIYRYKLAAEPVELPIWETFKARFTNVIEAKHEVLQTRDYYRARGRDSRIVDSRKHFRAYACDASSLGQVLPKESVDYIFTDPPYGGFITYLDLSILWNHWLGFPVTDSARDQETIVGGEKGHSEEHYRRGLACSVKTCFELLRADRWCSIVFQHWDVSYFATILEAAEESGAKLKAAITQTGNVIWSMHKKKNSEGVLSGELILTFYKPKRSRRKTAHAAPSTHDRKAVLSDVFDACLSNGRYTFGSELLFNQIVMELWRRRALSCLSLDRRVFVEELKSRGWSYNCRTHLWSKQEPQQHAKTLFDE